MANTKKSAQKTTWAKIFCNCFPFRKSSTEWIGKVFVVCTRRSYGNYVEVPDMFWIYWNEKFPSKFAEKLNKKINLSEENFHYFRSFPAWAESINFRVEFFFDVAEKVCCFLVAFEAYCLSVWCMRRDRKFPVLYYACMAICRTMSQLIEITVKWIAQHHKFGCCSMSV